MSTRSASPYSVLRAVDKESQNRFFGAGRELNGRCSRCHELGIHAISSRWKVVDDENHRMVPNHDGNMETDIATIMKRLIRDKGNPLVDICWCCNFVDRWSNGLGLCPPAFKRRTVTKFGTTCEEGLTDSGTNQLEPTRVVMFDVPTRELPIVRRTGSRPDYRRIQNWLRTCTSSHDVCRPDWSERLREIRVIDVKHRSIVHLPMNNSYLALSYVWGSSKQPSFPVSTEALPFRLPQKLPRTIEDAMRVTTKLEFAYLWVDSVCIDQSMPTDKATQIGLMDRIYRGAHATVVALDSSSADTGLSRVGRRRMKEGQMTVYHQGTMHYLSFLPTLREELDQSTWVKRGWTYQEGFLSHRCIFFGHKQVYFTCNVMSTSEDRSDSDERGRRPWRYSDRLAERHHPSHALVSPFRVFDAWKSMPPLAAFNSIIKEYTNRKFTNEEDTLDAVAGVMRVLQETVLPQGFLFGLPLDYFRSALLWTQNSVWPLRRRVIDCFPSWSWASWHLESPISIDNEMGDYCSHVQPPLEIRHLGKWINYEHRDASTLRRDKRDAKILKPLQALFKSTTNILFEDEDITVPAIHQGFLYVKGIILRLPYAQTLVQPGPNNTQQELLPQLKHLSSERFKREQSFSISQEALLETGKHEAKYDFLLISTIPMCIDSVDARLVWLQLLMLKWTNGVARRIGVAKILFSEDELVRLWPECDARYRGFWLG
jgi:hypothetical protein